MLSELNQGVEVKKNTTQDKSNTMNNALILLAKKPTAF